MTGTIPDFGDEGHSSATATNGERAPSRLPSGMRDWLPGQERRRVRVARQILASLDLFGYQRVSVPSFEYADVWDRGNADGTSDEVLRFVEPESGQIVALRSDVTPQIARLVTSRFGNGPWPARFCYAASVLRRRRERARLDRQHRQVGFELVGRDEVGGDLEVLEAATRSLEATGVEDFTVDLAHAQISLSLISGVSSERRPELVECLAVKDSSRLERLARKAGISGRTLEALVHLPELYGGEELWPRAHSLLEGTAAAEPLASLEAIWAAAVRAELAPRLVVDLGETRELYYYTGMTFHLLAEGPGEPLGSGGRYDTLFRRFGADQPAAGFAFDLGNVCWALSRHLATEPAPSKVLVTRPAGSSSEATLQVLRRLRQRSVACTRGPREGDAHSYAKQWGYTHVLELGAEGAAPRLHFTETGEQFTIGGADPTHVTEFVAARLGC